MRGVERKSARSKELPKVVGIHILPTRSLFASDIPHRLLRRVSLAIPTSARACSIAERFDALF